MYGLAAASDAGTATVPAGPCGTQWAWSIPSCWQWPKSLIYGDKYPNPPAPPVVGSTLPDGSPIPAVPSSESDASATVQAITNQQITDWQAQNQDFFANLNQNLQQDKGLPWWVWLAGGLTLVAMLAMPGGSPRRNGR